MQRVGQVKQEDLFFELANDEDTVVQPTRHKRTLSRVSGANNLRPLPPVPNGTSYEERRPGTTGQLVSSQSSFRQDEGVSSRFNTGRTQRHYDLPEGINRSPSRLIERVRSTDLSSQQLRRLSMNSAPAENITPARRHIPQNLHEIHTELPTAISEQKRSPSGSASVDSQTAVSTVWDELDDLKSRIKRLELTGKLPSTSGTAATGEQTERPRTATTAPTTIDSSPKHERSVGVGKNPDSDTLGDTSPAEVVTKVQVANLHPLLHSALAKAKPLLKPTLYRQLEATAMDALQLAAMTGSSGPQGAAFSAASIISAVTISDRQLRRKADAMCRNLTDLTLALCEGKHEAPSVVSSPIDLGTPTGHSSASRNLRNSFSKQDSITRPLSRLEARRVSILGSQVGSSTGNTAFESGEDLSASEQESTPSHRVVVESRRFARTGSRLQAARLPLYGDGSGDEDTIVRPLSRARTDAGHSRLHTSPQSHRTPSLRESLALRRVNATNATPGEVDETHSHHLNRVPSLSSVDGSRRRFHRDLDSTPSVIEEGTYKLDPNEHEFDNGVSLTGKAPTRVHSHRKIPSKHRLLSLGTSDSRYSDDMSAPGDGRDQAGAANERPGRSFSLRRRSVIE